MSDGVKVALIAGAFAIIAALITAMSPVGQKWLENKSKPDEPVVKSDPEPTTPKQTLCDYSYEIHAFYPKQYTDLNKPFGGDSANPGHLFNVKDLAPGTVISAECRHEGTSEEIVYCGPDRAARGMPTKTAEIEGWINGEGGPTHMKVHYQTACAAP